VGAETVDRAVFHAHGDHATAGAFVHDEVDGEILDEEFRRVAQRLAIERVQDRMAGAVGSGAGALGCWAFAIFRGHAAERALVNLALFGAREGHAPMFQLVNRFGRVLAEIFDGILVAQPVGPLDGVVHVPAPVILAHIAKSRRNAALRRHRMRAGWERPC
jgi:hypothetical protein